MKNIHLLKGYQIETQGSICTIMEVSADNTIIRTDKLSSVYNDDNFKILVRPWESMTAEEARVLYKIYWGSEYVNLKPSSDLDPDKRSPNYSDIVRIINGQDFVAGGFEETVNMVPALLKMRFDVWNLVKLGKGKFYDYTTDTVTP